MTSVPLAMSTAAAFEQTEATPPVEDVAGFTRRLAAAEDAAWSEAHRRYAHRLLRYLLVAAHGDEQAAGDALQACFVRAVRHIRVFASEEALWSWFTLLARHSLADTRRSTGRWRRFLAHWKPVALENSHPPPIPPWSEYLQAALESLDANERRLLEEKYFHGASVRTLAWQSGSTEKAVESRLSRARAKLRSMLIQIIRQESTRS